MNTGLFEFDKKAHYLKGYTVIGLQNDIPDDVLKELFSTFRVVVKFHAISSKKNDLAQSGIVQVYAPVDATSYLIKVNPKVRPDNLCALLQGRQVCKVFFDGMNGVREAYIRWTVLCSNIYCLKTVYQHRVGKLVPVPPLPILAD